jgi:hypothetical protein
MGAAGALAVSFQIADVNADGMPRSVEKDADSRVRSPEADDLGSRGPVAGHPFTAERAQSNPLANLEGLFFSRHRFVARHTHAFV